MKWMVKSNDSKEVLLIDADVLKTHAGYAILYKNDKEVGSFFAYNYIVQLDVREDDIFTSKYRLDSS